MINVKNKKKLFMKGVIICFLILFATSCGNKNEIVTNAQEYLKQKYGRNFEVKNTENIYQESIFVPSKSETIITFNDGVNVVYSYSQEKYYDNYQSKDILNDIKEEIWNPMIQKLSPVYENLTNNTNDYSKFNNSIFSDNLLESTSESFFHNYYTGDIKNYLLKEPVQVYLSDGIFIISEDNNSYQERLDIFKDTINKYFSHDNVRYTVLTNELYNALSEYKESLGNDSFRFDSTFDYCIYDGCWIKGWLSSLEQNRYSIQKFIKIIDGLYVSNVEIPLKKDDIVLLEDGDITFKESITRKELQNMIDSRIEPTDKYRYIINTNKPIYKMELSDNYKNKIKDNNYYIHLIFKIDKDELKISSKNNLYLFDSNKKQNDQNVNYSNIIAFGDMIKRYSDDDDDEFKKFALSKYTYIDVLIPIKDLENQYFWIGNQTREELNNNVEE